MPSRRKLYREPTPDQNLSLEQLLDIARNVGNQLSNEDCVEELRGTLRDGTIPLQEALVVNIPEQVSDFRRDRIRQLLAERAKRKCEALKLYEPFPVSVDFHECKSRERLVRGSNRSGKTTTCAVEFAWAVCGKHPSLSGVKGGYPLENGNAIVVGYDEGHLGNVIYPMLFKAGAFYIIRDLKTKQWRAYRPWEPEDLARENEAKPAPPLIPPRMIKGKIAWRKKSLNIPEKVTLTNGWVISFYSSKAKPVQGVVFDLIWFDEELERQSPSWYAEMTMRVGKKAKLRFIWSATPHVGGDDLLDLHDRAERDKHKAVPLVTEYLMTLLDNPHIPEEEKNLIREKFKNKPDELRVRFFGEYARYGSLVYPEFSLTVHEMKRSAMRTTDRNEQVPYFPGNQVPLDWARFVAIDPGRQFLAAIFCAVPPPSVGNFILFYDELYIRQADARQFGEAMELKTRNQSFEAFIIDRHGSQVSDTGSGLEIEFQYSEALRTRGIWERVRRRSFQSGESDRAQGIESFRNWLLLRDDGQPTVRILENSMENFQNEIRNWCFRKVKGELKSKPEERNNHLMDCARYLALYQPVYRKPKPAEKLKTAAVLRFEEKRRMAQEAHGDESFINFGPSASPSLAH